MLDVDQTGQIGRQAIEEELAMIRDAGTWILVEPPAGANIVGSKWVF